MANLLGEKTYIYEKGTSPREIYEPGQIELFVQKLLGSLGKIGKKTKNNPSGILGDYVSPTPTPQSTKPTREELIRAMVEGSTKNGVTDPVATMSAQMVDQGQTMPIFQKYPFLPIAQSQLESRGFKDFGENPLVVNPKQGFGWAVDTEGYNPPIEQVLTDMLTAVGTGREGETNPVRLRNAGYYEPFRRTGNLDEYANTYAGPVSERNPNAGEIYANNLRYVMSLYAQALDRIMKERGGSYPVTY